MKDPIERFSDRVENYEKYRPSYPTQVIETLRTILNLHRDSVVADIASGTGIFSKLLLECGFKVLAVEPNEKMRLSAEKALAGNPLFVSVIGEAEKTNLEDSSVDLITCAQAFHWFRRTETRKEFKRILKPEGAVALIWNQRKTDSPFMQAYEIFVRKHAPEYTSVNHTNIEKPTIIDFLGAKGYKTFSFENSQRLNREGIIGRTLSTSYIPGPDQPGHIEMMKDLSDLFTKFEENGIVNFDYDCYLYLGTMS
ncbi:MAG: class I SAM-dependent methyltransferase [Candidatus Riflebacteria bacterium]|nr:class I SAM-dependent methyltransferase [Candidatus Riflebacteria bacterium]